MKKLFCRLFGHKLTLEIRRDEQIRLSCLRCKQRDPYGPAPRHPHEIDNREHPLVHR